MSGKIAQEISQTKPFTAVEEEIFLNLARTTEFLSQGLAELFRQYNLSLTQYNVLRILRGAGPEGLSCTDAARRMITHDPDITRLFDRLEARELIARTRSKTDRRVVVAVITASGLELLGQIDQPLLDLHGEQFGSLSLDEKARLIDFLERLRP